VTVLGLCSQNLIARCGDQVYVSNLNIHLAPDMLMIIGPKVLPREVMVSLEVLMWGTFSNIVVELCSNMNNWLFPLFSMFK